MANPRPLITEEQKARYRAFWDRSNTGRAAMYLTSWDGSPSYPGTDDPGRKWGDLAMREAKAVYDTEHTRYHADAFPTVFTNFGPGCMAAMVGGNYLFAPDTVWFEAAPLFVRDWEDDPTPVLNRGSDMFRMVEEMTCRLLSHSGLFYTSVCDIGGSYDMIAALRGTENLLYDMYDYPGEVRAFAQKLQPLWRAYHTEYASRLIAEQGCMTSWMPIWSDTPYYPLQCDYCAMLSPAMFRDFILPDLKYQTEFLDRSIYHLDGPGELPHVDMLLSLPRLNAIQWTSGDGNPPLWDPCWFDLYRRILGAGKGLVLLGADPGKMEAVFRAVGQRGMYITAGVRDAQEAGEFCRMAEAAAAERKE